ncbi:unnamed protein product [Ascophyllum nodosum]
MRKKWDSSMLIGATQGLGHGFSATVIELAVRRSFSRTGLDSTITKDLFLSWAHGPKALWMFR